MRYLFLILLFPLFASGQGVLINSYRYGGGAPAPTEIFANQKSIDFDGVNEYVSVPDADNLSFTDDTVFIGAWIKMDDATNYVIAEKEGEYLFWVNASDKLEARFIDSTTGGYIGRTYNTAITADENRWMHYTASLAGTTIDIYRNGVIVDDTDANSGSFTQMRNTANGLNLGYDGSNYADGKFDQVIIGGDGVSVSDVKESMTIRDLSYYSVPVVSWWEFDDDTIGTDGITDRVGDNDGTIQNGEYSDLNLCVTWPYSYQLDTTATAENLTPMQSASDTSFSGFGIDLDGAAEYVTIADNDVLSFTDNTVYLAAWVYMDDATGFTFFDKANEYLFLSNASDHLEVRFIDNTTGGYVGRTFNTAITLLQNRWIFVEATFNGTVIDIRLNGITVDDTDANSGSFTQMRNTASALRLGYDGSVYSNGRIGDMWIGNEYVTDSYFNAHAPTNLNTTSLTAAGYWRPYNSTNTAGGVLDQSGNGNNGTCTNCDNADFMYSTAREVYRSDSAGSFDFDAVNEYVIVSDSDTFSYTNGATDLPFTHSVRHLWTGATAYWYYAYKYSGGVGNREYFTFFDNSPAAQIGIYLESSAGNLLGAQTSTSITAGRWTMITWTYDGSETYAGLKIYFDGIEQPTTDITIGTYTGMSNSTSDLELFGRAADRRLRGYIGETFAIKNKALTQCEIQEVYNGGSPVNPAKWTFYGDIDEAAIWYFNQQDSPTGVVYDRFGANFGTPQNMEAGDLNTIIYPAN